MTSQAVAPLAYAPTSLFLDAIPKREKFIDENEQPPLALGLITMDDQKMIPAGYKTHLYPHRIILIPH